MRENLFDEMLARHSTGTERERLAATREVMQQVALAGLYRGGFFEEAAFYGGTCLRLCYGLDRFSEDMDFSLLRPDAGFTLERFFDAVIAEFALLGRDVDSDTFIRLLREKITHTDIAKAREDVLPFIDDASRLAIWSREYFTLLSEKILFA